MRHLRYFVAVAEELNFTRAAVHLNIAQPPLSVQIHKLELEIGTDLFVREGRGIKLSAAGIAFLKYAHHALNYADQGVKVAREISAGCIDHLAIGYINTAAYMVLRQLIPAFKRKFAGVSFDFHPQMLEEKLEPLRRDEIDIEFNWLPIPKGEFDVAKLIDVPIIAILPKNHRLVNAPSVSIMDLSGEPLILPPRVAARESIDEITQLFARVGSTMNVTRIAGPETALLAFVAMGIGCTLLPSYVSAFQMDDIVFKPLAPPNIVKTLAVIKKKRRGGLAETLHTFAANFPLDA